MASLKVITLLSFIGSVAGGPYLGSVAGSVPLTDLEWDSPPLEARRDAPPSSELWPLSNWNGIGEEPDSELRDAEDIYWGDDSKTKFF